MTQKELIREIADSTGINHRDVWLVLKYLAGMTRDCLVDDGIAHLPALGKMVIVERAARQGRNPKTGEPVQIPAKRAVVFRPSKQLSEAVNGTA